MLCQELAGEFSSDSFTACPSLDGDISSDNFFGDLSLDDFFGKISSDDFFGEFSSDDLAGEFSSDDFFGEFSSDDLAGRFSSDGLVGEFSSDDFDGEFTTEDSYDDSFRLWSIRRESLNVTILSLKLFDSQTISWPKVYLNAGRKQWRYFSLNILSDYSIHCFNIGRKLLFEK